MDIFVVLEAIFSKNYGFLKIGLFTAGFSFFVKEKTFFTKKSFVLESRTASLKWTL